MNDIELLRKLSKKYELTQVDIADVIKTSKAYISQVFKGKSNLSKEKKKILLEHYPIDIDQENNFIDVYYFNDVCASCGSGSLVDYISPETEIMQISNKYGLNQNNKYFCVSAMGDSMAETIHDKEIVIFEDWSNKQIIDNKIYLFAYDNKVYIKRLAFNIDEVIITSDNKTKDETGAFIYETKKIKGDDINRLFIYGKFRGKIERD